ELIVNTDYGKISSNHDTQFVVVRAVNVDFPNFYSDVGAAISLVSNRTIRFPHSIYRLKIAENVPVGTTLSPSIEVFPKSPSVNYTINPSSPLSILPNGTLFVSSPIDLEELPVDLASNLYFLVAATVGSMEAVTKVQLKVKDVNEYVPKFERKLYEVRIGEDVAAGSPIVRLNATDLDKTDGSHLLYKVVGGSGRNLVFVQEDGTLILSDVLPGREIPMSFTVVVEAIDKGGKRDTTTVHVVLTDVNDNRPVFASPSLTWNVIEGTTNDSLEIYASDQDSGQNAELEFRIVEGNDGHHFSIEKISPNIALLRIISPLDYETKPFFNLVIEAADRGNPPQMSTASVSVNVINRNDNPPIFQKVNFEQQVFSDLPIGQPLLTLAVNDADHDRLSFSLSGDEACSSLTVNPLGVVAFSKPVSKRKTGMMTCVVSATDGVHVSNATLRLKILESLQSTTESLEQNHSPRFAKELYTFVINSSQNGELLEKVTAVDQDGDVIRYSIEPPELRNLFAIDAEGQLSVRVPVSAFKQALYSFLVIAEDSGKPIMSSFTNIRVLIPENNVLATRNLLADTTSAMTSAGDGSFQNNMEDSVTTTGPHYSLSTADERSTTLKDETTSPAAPTTSEVRFIQPNYTYAIRSDSPIGTSLGRVELTNGSEVQLVFKYNKLFTIDRNFWIRTTQTLNTPTKIEDEILAVRDGVLLTSVPFVVWITATSDSNDLSSTDTSLGQSFYTKDTTFSSPSTTPISFESATATVATTVDVSYSQSSTANEAFAFSQPIYFAFVPEGEYTNGIRVALKPEALSVNKNTSVKFEISDNVRNLPFFLTTDGQLIVFDVDRELRAVYSFPIKATSTDFGEAQALLNVTVLDINDNYPVFDPAPSIIGVFRDIAVGVPLHRFTARDLDTDNYGAVNYGLEKTQTPFNVDPTAGILFVSGSLKSTSDAEFAITVFARDGGRPSLKSTQKLIIHVFEPAVKRPQFPNGLPGMVVFDGAMPGSEVGTALAGPTINIMQPNEKISYGLIEDYNGLFKIEDGGRVILNREPTDGEKNRYFQLNITAENSYGKDSVLMDVFIESQTSSAKPRSTTQEHSTTSSCYFPTKVYNTEILENRDGHNRIAKVTSSCEENGQPFQYSFSKPTEYFELIPSTGEIFAVRMLDRERRTYHFLYVAVSSGKRTARQNPIVEKAKKKLTKFETLVVVRVLDQNDNAPVFVRLSPDHSVTGVVLWQARLFSSILKLEVHVISPSSSLVQLTAELPPSQLDQSVVVRTLNELTGMANHLVAKQPFVDSEGHINATRSHLFVYALDRSSRVPYSKEDLMSALEQHAASLFSSPSKISHMSFLSSSPSIYSAFDFILAILCIILFLLLLGACCFIGSYYKRKRKAISSSEREYMVSSATGPRPYDVEVFSRTTAQRVLSARPLPEPLTNQIEVAVSPIFVEKMLNADRSITSTNHANSIRERPSLLQSALSRQKVHTTTTVPAKSQQ
ncbi:hypothetical protein Angca_002369, partial [Angiostrongylus cantonensis]